MVFQFAWTEFTLMFAPLVLGLLIGSLAKHSMKIAVLIVALVVALVTLGYVSFTYMGFYNEFLAPLVRWIINSMNFLPYSSVAFLAGLVLGFWKG